MLELPNKSRLTVEQVAEFYQVAPRTVRGWISQGIIEARKIGGILRIPREAVEKAEISTLE